MMFKNQIFKSLVVIVFLFIQTPALGEKLSEEELTPTFKILTTDEIRTALAKVPTQYIIPPLLRNTLKDMGKDNDREVVLGLLKLSEIKGIAWLNSLYPNVRFFKGIYAGDLTKEPFVYLMAIRNDDSYFMPDEFNRLFRKSRMKINDRNMIPVAKAIVLLILGSEPFEGLVIAGEKELIAFPKITFFEGKRIRERVKGIAYQVKLKLKINEQVEDWFFNVSYGQFELISIGDPQKPIKKYTLPTFDRMKLGPWWRGY